MRDWPGAIQRYQGTRPARSLRDPAGAGVASQLQYQRETRIVVGVARAELSLPGASSLKDKRRLIKSLVERAQHRFRVSAAEVDHHDQWRRAAVAFACISTSTGHAHAMLSAIQEFIDHQGEIVLMDYQVEVR